MAVLGPLARPTCVFGSPVDVFDLVQRVLHERLQVPGRASTCGLSQRVAGVDGQQRLHLQVLAPLQKLQQAQAVGER